GDLPGAYLGTVTDGTVWIDRDAAGHGWYIDPTPRDDSEFPARPGGPAFGREDLLTVVMHEMGHLLGFEDGGQGLMETVLHAGVRQAPSGPILIVPDPVAAPGAPSVPAKTPSAAGPASAPVLLDSVALRNLLAADQAFVWALSGGPTLPPR